MPQNFGRLWNRNATPPSLTSTVNPYAGYAPRRREAFAGYPGYTSGQDTLPGYHSTRPRGGGNVIPGVGGPRRTVWRGWGWQAGGIDNPQQWPQVSAPASPGRNAPATPFTAPFPALLGRPGFSYTRALPSKRAGPLPKLSSGTGRTAARASTSGTAAQLPSHVTEPDYQPIPFDYQPPLNAEFHREVPKSVRLGMDGVGLVGTYRAHEFTIAAYQQTQWRSAAAWQDQSFPVDFRTLLPAQQAAKYNVHTPVQLARPVDRSAYFLGYRTDPQANPQMVAGYGQMPLGQGGA